MSEEMGPVVLAFIAMIAYLLGSIPFGLLLTRAAGLGDIRKIGSGNIGATNVLRTGRKGLAAATLLLDGGKGALAVLLGGAVSGLPGVLTAGVAVVVGHLFPIWLRFRGGKGVATGLGVLLAAAPLVGLTALVVWLLTAALTRMSSAAALAAFATAPIFVAIMAPYALILALCVIVTLLVVVRHEENIRRLISGTEPRIGERR
jgi:acyl phosphate:glycerol-3-phosphate acyltransferase